MEVTFRLKDKVKLETGDMSISPSLMRWEENYGLSQSRNVLFTFPAENDTGNMRFLYADDVFYTGVSHFLFRQKDIQKTPELKTNEKNKQ